jgi:hypothetical protein
MQNRDQQNNAPSTGKANSPGSISADEEITLKDIILIVRHWFRYLRTKWLTILVAALIGGLVGLGYAFFKKPIYTATTTFVLEDEKGGGGLGSLIGLASMAGVDLGGSGGSIFQGDNILSLYKSRTMLEKTLLSEIGSDTGQLLIDRYIQMNKLKKKWSDKPELLDLEFYPDSSVREDFTNPARRLRDSILGEVVEDINKNYLFVSKPDKKLGIIEVDVSSKDEVFSKALNDILVKNVSELYIRTKTKRSAENVAILQYKTDSVRSVMNRAIYETVAVADATPNLNATRQIKRVAPAQRAQFSAETNKAVLGELIKNLEMSKISLLRETPLIQIVDKPILPLEVDKLGKIKGIVGGALLAGFLTVILLILRRNYGDAF